MKAILKEHNITSVPDYRKLCEQDERVPSDPKEVYKQAFKGWLDYLTIDATHFHSLTECSKKVNEIIRASTSLRLRKLKNELAHIVSVASEMDDKIPSSIELIEDLYQMKSLNDFLKR